MTDDRETAADTPPESGETPVIKAMRRQPCPCGSGKVFKNCHEGQPGYAVATDPSEAASAPAGAHEPGQRAPAHAKFSGPAKTFNQAAPNKGAPRRRKV